jgi:hypothetical protein
MAPGRPLKDVLLSAGWRSTRFVHQWANVEGWHISSCIPIVDAFFKIDRRGNIYACARIPQTRRYEEKLAGRFVNRDSIELV